MLDTGLCILHLRNIKLWSLIQLLYLNVFDYKNALKLLVCKSRHYCCFFSSSLFSKKTCRDQEACSCYTGLSCNIDFVQLIGALVP